MTTTESTGAVEETHGQTNGCPAFEYNPYLIEPVNGHTLAMDALREQHPIFKSTMGPGWYNVTRMDAVRKALRQPALFSSRSVSPMDANPSYKWIPEMLDPPEHTKWRDRKSVV